MCPRSDVKVDHTCAAEIPVLTECQIPVISGVTQVGFKRPPRDAKRPLGQPSTRDGNQLSHPLLAGLAAQGKVRYVCNLRSPDWSEKIGVHSVVESEDLRSTHLRQAGCDSFRIDKKQVIF